MVDLETNEVAGKIRRGWGNRLWFYQFPHDVNRWRRVDRKKKAIKALTEGDYHHAERT